MGKKVFFGLFVIWLTLFLISTAWLSASTSNPAGKSAWWDKFGEPEYGGRLNIRASGLASGSIGFDPSKMMGPPYHYWLERLFFFDWTVDREIDSFKSEFVPVEHHAGVLAKNWEQKDPLIYVVHLRQGIKWQNKPPVNGREFTADDVQYSYDRLLGTGSGFTEKNPFFKDALSNIERVVATDRYTVEFKFKQPSIFNIYDIVCPQFTSGLIVAPEWEKQGELQNWKKAVGTGPWMVEEFIGGVSLTFRANPNYWGYDERHPENRLPYIESIKVVQIPEMSTAIAALRTGKIDMIGESRFGPTWKAANNIVKTNPEIQKGWWASSGPSISLRCDKEPFTDIRVRQALQMAIDRDTIARTYYSNTVDGIPAGLSHPLHYGWTSPFDEWPVKAREVCTYNKEKARELLAKAGFPEGFKTNIVASSSDDVEVLEIIKAQFQEIGVDMEIQTMDMPTFMSLLRDGKYEQMAYDKKSGTFERPSMAILSFKTGFKENYSFVSDPYYDSLVEQFQGVNTIDEAQQLFIKADIYSMEQGWRIVTFPISVPVLWQSYLKGYSCEQLQGEVLGYYGARWWIDREIKNSIRR